MRRCDKGKGSECLLAMGHKDTCWSWYLQRDTLGELIMDIHVQNAWDIFCLSWNAITLACIFGRE